MLMLLGLDASPRHFGNEGGEGCGHCSCKDSNKGVCAHERVGASGSAGVATTQSDSVSYRIENMMSLLGGSKRRRERGWEGVMLRYISTLG